MNSLSRTSKNNRHSWSKFLVVVSGTAVLGALPVSAQTTYTAVDLTPVTSGAATAASGGQAAGYTGLVPNAFSGRATLWTGGGPIDLHPAFLEGTGSRSTVAGMSGNLQVGSGAGTATGNRNVPLAWRGSAASASVLDIPVVNSGGQATATDGVQIVGSIVGLDRDGTTIGTNHAMIWDVATGVATDIGEGATLFGVAAGQQVGWVLKGNANAALWRGTKAYTLLHPKNAVVSVANATDGVRQVGYAGFDVRVRREAAKGNKDKRFNYAYVWTGSSASALNIHPYASDADGALLENSFALNVSGSVIVGYATNPAQTGTPGYNRAIVWDADFQATDLNAVLPPDFIGSQAYAVDAAGNVAGVMTKADGTRHAVVWVPNP